MAGQEQYTNFAILGLGRFGMSVAQTLSDYDVNIMLCDRDEAKLQRASACATHLVQLDITDENALEKLGLGNFEVVIIATGDDFEASLVAAMIAREGGTKHIIVKAKNSRQKSILEKMGVHEVILPEHEIGAKLARKMVSLNITDILEESPLYTITEMRPMDEWVGKTLQQADIRRAHNITVLGVRHGKKLIIPVQADTMIHDGDVLIALNENKKHSIRQNAKQ